MKKNVRTILATVLATALIGTELLCGPDVFASAKIETAENGFASEIVETAENDAEYSLLASGLAEASDDADGERSRLLVVSDAPLDLSAVEGITGAVSNGEDLYTLQFGSEEDARRAYDVLRSMRAVASVEFDRTIKVLGTAESPAFEAKALAAAPAHKSWGASAIGVDQYAPRIPASASQAVIVAVVDTGIDSTHSMFADRLTNGFDFVNNDLKPEDRNGHGTHVAGIVADCTVGEKEIRIMPVKALDSQGAGSASEIANGILFASSRGASVINASMGGTHSDYLDRVVNSAIANGTAVIAAAGNDGAAIDPYFDCPAHIWDVITVGAVNKDLNAAGFSNYGRMLDVMAPGTSIKSAAPGNAYATFDGTSMAAPHVSACAALLCRNYGRMSVRKLTSLIYRSCNARKNVLRYGKGIVDLGNLTGGIGKNNIRPAKKQHVYRPGGVRPKILVKRNGEALFRGKDYKVTYRNNTSVGTGVAIIRGAGTYSGSVRRTFRIVPRGTRIRRIRGRRRGFFVRWKRRAGKMPSRRIMGYQIRYSRKADMSASRKVKVRGYRRTSKRIGGLRPGRRYYVRIRTYMRKNGRTYYSPWSGKRSVKTK